MSDYKQGTDLILSLGGEPIGYSTTCKISTSAETAERATKEVGAGKFKEKYVKTLSEQITTEGFEVKGYRTPYEDLKALMVASKPVQVNYCFLDEKKGYQGMYVITSLDLDGAAGEDAKFSLTLESTGEFKQATITQTRTTKATAAASIAPTPEVKDAATKTPSA